MDREVSIKSQASTVTGCCQDLAITSAQQQLDLATGKFRLRIMAKKRACFFGVIREMVLGKHASYRFMSATLTFSVVTKQLQGHFHYVLGDHL